MKIIREDRRVNQNRDFEINSIDGIPRIFSGKDFSVVFEREEALCLVKELMDCSFLNPWPMILLTGKMEGMAESIEARAEKQQHSAGCGFGSGEMINYVREGINDFVKSRAY